MILFMAVEQRTLLILRYDSIRIVVGLLHTPICGEILGTCINEEFKFETKDPCKSLNIKF